MKNLPKARNKDVVVQELGEEILIYDLKLHKAYNLNKAAAAVYRACDGKTPFDEIKRKNGFTDDAIFLALDELKKESLLGDCQYDSPFAGISRRDVIKRVGLGTMMALPVISALVAPSAVSAASNACTCTAAAGTNARLENCPCVGNEDCCGVCLAATSTCSAVTAGSASTAAACCPPIPPRPPA